MEDARKIVESAEQEITAAAKTARRELTAYAANLGSFAGGQTDQGGRGYGSGAGAGVSPESFGGRQNRQGRELAYGFRHQHLRARLGRRGF